MVAVEGRSLPLEGEKWWKTTSWERGCPARTRPGTAWPISATSIDARTAPLLPFCLADAVPAGRVAACRIALKLSGRQSAKAVGCP